MSEVNKALLNTNTEAFIPAFLPVSTEARGSSSISVSPLESISTSRRTLKSRRRLRDASRTVPLRVATHSLQRPTIGGALVSISEVNNDLLNTNADCSHQRSSQCPLKLVVPRRRSRVLPWSRSRSPWALELRRRLSDASRIVPFPGCL